MMYATNGKVQDLPSSAQFDFWNQVDWGIAFNIAKVEQNLLVGADRAPHQELAIHLLLDAVMRDKWSVFKSRPKGQQVNWEGWGDFCSYYLRGDVFAQQAMLGDMVRGYVASWFPRFLATNTRAAGSACFRNQKAPHIVYWDFHEFDRATCKSVRKIPATWPTPQEIALGQAYAQWWESLLGQNETRKLVTSPPTASQRAEVASTAPPPAPPELRLQDQDAVWEQTKSKPTFNLYLLTDEALAYLGSPFETVAQFMAALEGPYQQDICAWFNSVGARALSELEAKGVSLQDLGNELELRSEIKPSVREATEDFPKLNAQAYERYMHCFYDGLFHPPSKKSSGGLLWVAAAGALGLGLWLFTRRG